MQVESGSICQAEVALTGFCIRNRAAGLILPTLQRLVKGGAMRPVGGHPRTGVDGSGGGQEGPAGVEGPTDHPDVGCCWVRAGPGGALVLLASMTLWFISRRAYRGRGGG